MSSILKFIAVIISLLTAFNNVLPLPLSLTKKLAEDFASSYTVHESSPSNLGEYTEKDYPLVKDADFYVSADGSDSNSGTFDSPFATIEKARDEVRKLSREGSDGITVAVKAGEYRVSSLEFTQEDSGTESCPVTYCAYGDGEVILNGGISVDGKAFSKVNNSVMLSRLSDDAKEKVLCVDLNEYGITAQQYGKIYAIGSYNTAAQYDGDYTGDLYCELFVNDIRQTIARYPDEGYLYTGEVVKTGLGRESDGAATAVENWESIRNPESDVYKIDSALSERISNWKELDDVWMFGFWKYDWADASTPVGRVDFEKKELSPKFVSMYGTKKDAPYYFFNVFEELDSPGEWYLDRKNGIVYIYPDGELSKAVVDLSLSTKPIITVNKADYLNFRGLTLKGTRGNGIEIIGNNNSFSLGTVKNISGNAIYASGSNNLVSENEITRTGKGGIILDGGDAPTLTPGNNKADNNLIHDWSEIYQTYQPAVTLCGVGNTCSHNEIYNSPHEAITFSGNYHIIEYNNIHDVCLLSDDAGAIYSGRHWDHYGNVIRYNAVYNLGSGEHRPDGIYMDDALSGETIYGNLLVNVPKIGLHLGGGRDLTVKNNIIINSNDRSISYDSRARDGVQGGWFEGMSKAGGTLWQRLDESPWQTETWQKAFPQMAKISRDFSDIDNPDFGPNPAYSVVEGNLIVNVTCSIGSISEAAERFSTVDNNAIFGVYKLGKIFTNPGSGDYTLKTDSPVYDEIPGFEQLPLNEIGRY